MPSWDRTIVPSHWSRMRCEHKEMKRKRGNLFRRRNYADSIFALWILPYGTVWSGLRPLLRSSSWWCCCYCRFVRDVVAIRYRWFLCILLATIVIAHRHRKPVVWVLFRLSSVLALFLSLLGHRRRLQSSVDGYDVANLLTGFSAHATVVGSSAFHRVWLDSPLLTLRPVSVQCIPTLFSLISCNDDYC